MQQLLEKKIVNLRKWRYPLTKEYNGFTPIERIRGWQVTRWLVDTSQIPDPKSQTCQCSICGEPKASGYHNEDYYQPWTAVRICKSCHYHTHTRFRRPGALETLRERAGKRIGAEWVLALSTEKIDLAGDRRVEFGEEIRQFPSLISSPVRFPFDQLHSL